MESGILSEVVLPVALGVIMLGLGLSLTLEDFKRVLVYPRAVVVALACQVLLLPLVCFGVAKAFGLPPELAVGLMLLAASPGGATANLFSHLAHGDVALNITLTAVNSLISLFTLPVIVNTSMQLFMSESHQIGLVFAKVVQVFAIVLVPVAIGMSVRSAFPETAERMNRPVKILSVVFLGLVIAAAIVKEREHVLDYVRLVGLAALVFNLASMALGYIIPRAAGVERRQAVASGMEIGIHNCVLAIYIGSSPAMLNNPRMSIPASIYAMIMLITAAGFSWYLSRQAHAEEDVAVASAN